MQFRFNVNQDEQYVLYTLAKTFNPADDLAEVHAHAAHLPQIMEAPIYRIFDLNHVDFDFGTMAHFLQLDTSNEMGTATDRRFIPLFIGRDKTTKLIAESLAQEQYGGVEAICFPTMDAVISFIQEDTKRRLA